MTAREIVRIAARGDGITRDGEHFANAVTGDSVQTDGSVAHGPHHVTPVCAHFGRCGGCQLQHGDEEVLAQFVRERVLNAALGQGLEVDELLNEHLSPPNSRRRATLHAQRIKNDARIGFKEGRSHKIVDLSQCPVLRPELMALIAPLRTLVTDFGPKAVVDIALSLCDQGVDVSLNHFALDGLVATEAALEFAQSQKLARLSVDQGYGAETIWEPDAATVTLSGVPVGLPQNAFLQATLDAEALMVETASNWLHDAKIVADLFSGLGTFAFAFAKGGPEARKVLAVEADQAAHLSCKLAATRTGGKVLTLHRDLFRNPLTSDELGRFDGALLDPPRAGAKAQIAQVAQSSLPKCVYVSCNPSSWARDAAVLADAGFSLRKLMPIGQFRWSTHVELISLFER